MTPSSCCPDTTGRPCKHVFQAATFRHLECMKHFWGLRNKGDPEEETLEKLAVSAALTRKDVAILKCLLSRGCPWDQRHVDIFFSAAHTRPWTEWHDLYDIAFKYKLPGYTSKELLLAFMNEGHWDFLEKLHHLYGQTFEEVHTWRLAFNGANVAALRELHMREAFRTADLSWLTPCLALGINDLDLLKFACELDPAQVPMAKAIVENPAKRDWLDNHFNDGGSYPGAPVGC